MTSAPMMPTRLAYRCLADVPGLAAACERHRHTPVIYSMMDAETERVQPGDVCATLTLAGAEVTESTGRRAAIGVVVARAVPVAGWRFRVTFCVPAEISLGAPAGRKRGKS